MDKFIDRMLLGIVFSLFVVCLGFNASMVWAQTECADVAAADGACTSCDEDYTTSRPACDLDSGCAGSGYMISSAGLGTTKSIGNRVVYLGDLPCLFAVKCKLITTEEEGETCTTWQNDDLASGPMYLTAGC